MTFDPSVFEKKTAERKARLSSLSGLTWADDIKSQEDALSVMKRADVQADIREYYRLRDGWVPETEEDLWNRFYSDRTMANVNTMGAGMDLNDAYNLPEDQVRRLGRLQTLYDNLPNFYEKGGRGLKGLAQNVAYAAIDPLNAISLGAGGRAASMAARAAARQAIKKAGSAAAVDAAGRAAIVAKTVKAGAIAGVKAGVPAEALIGGVQSDLIQRRNVEIGIQNEYSVGQTAADAAFSGAIGGAIGGVMGAAGAAMARPLRPKANVGPATFEERTDVKTLGQAEAEAANTPEATQPTKEEVEDAEVQSYISSSRQRHQQSIDATIDDIREESGDRLLSDWQRGAIDDADKTPAMKQADELRDARASLEEVFNWPRARDAHVREIERIKVNQKLDSGSLAILSEKEELVRRGDDAYNAIVKAAKDKQPEKIDDILISYGQFKKNPRGAIFDANEGRQIEIKAAQTAAQPVPVVPKSDDEVSAAIRAIIDNQTGKSDPALLDELKVSIEGETSSPEAARAALEKYLKAQAPEPAAAVVTEPAPAAQPEVATPDLTPEDLESSVGDLNKEYNAISNKINRLNKKKQAGKITPEEEAKITQLVLDRDAVSSSIKDIKARIEKANAEAASVATESAANVVDGLLKSAKLDTATEVVDFLSKLGVDKDIAKSGLAKALKEAGNVSKVQRAEVIRSYAAKTAQYIKSVTQLEKLFEETNDAIIYHSESFDAVLGLDNTLSAKDKELVSLRYNEWLEQQAPVVFAQALQDFPDYTVDDLLAEIERINGKRFADIIKSTLLNQDNNEIVLNMSVKSKGPAWAQLTSEQKNYVERQMAIAKEKLYQKLGYAMSPKILDAQLAIMEQTMVANIIRDDIVAAFDKAPSDMAGMFELGGNRSYPIIKDPEDNVTVSGKVFQSKTGNAVPVIDRRPGKGLQSMVQKAIGGRASGIDTTGNLVIEHPFYGTLFIKKIKRNANGEIDFMSADDGSYIYKETNLKDGSVWRRKIAKTFSAQETARIEMQQNRIENARGTIVKADREVKDANGNILIEKGKLYPEKRIKAAEVEGERNSAIIKKADEAIVNRELSPEEAAAEQRNKELRKQVSEMRKAAKATDIKQAIRHADAVAPANPEKQLQENISVFTQETGEPVTIQDIENARESIMNEDLTDALVSQKKKLQSEAWERFQLTGDFEEFKKEIADIEAMTNPRNVKPRPRTVKPDGAENEPLIMVHKGYEIDVKNHIRWKKNGDIFFPQIDVDVPVGKYVANKDGTYTIFFENADGFEIQLKSTKERLPEAAVRAFGHLIEKLGNEGKLTKSMMDNVDPVKIDWKASRTWGDAKREVPVAEEVKAPAKIIGKVSDWKTNPDVSAANLDLPHNTEMAIQIMSGDAAGLVRVESVKNGSGTQTVADILKAKLSEKYVIGYVPAGTKSNSLKARQLFKPLDTKDGYMNYANEVVKAVESEEIPEIGQDKLAEMLLSQEDSAALRQYGVNVMTMADVDMAITRAEVADWNSSISTSDGLAAHINKLKTLYAIKAKYAPSGIKKPTAARSVSIRQIKEILTSYAADDLYSTLDFLNNVSYKDGNLPIFSVMNNPEVAAGQFSPISNKVAISTNNISGKEAFPVTVSIIHETSHWAYFNLLTDAERLNFWESLEKYYRDGQVNISAIQKVLPGIAKNEIDSPQELFANMFTAWAISKKQIANAPLWERVAAKLKAWLQVFIGIASGKVNDTIEFDPDMVKLFLRVMPENDAMYGRFSEISRVLEDIRSQKNNKYTSGAHTAAGALIKFDLLRKQIDDAIRSANPYDLRATLREVQGDIYGKVGGKAGQTRHPLDKNNLKSGGKRLRILDGKPSRGKLLRVNDRWRELDRKLMGMEDGEKGMLKDTSLDDGHVTSLLNEIAIDTIDALAHGQKDLAHAIYTYTSNNFKNVSQEVLPIKVNMDGSYSYAKPSAKQQQYARIGAAKKAAQIKEAASVLEQINNQSATQNDRDLLPVVDGDEQFSKEAVSQMSLTEIVNELKSITGERTPRRNELVAALKSSIKKLPPVAQEDVDPLLLTKSYEQLTKLVRSAINKGDKKQMDKVITAMRYRGDVKDTKVLKPTKKVADASKIVDELTSVGVSDNGVPVAVGPQVGAIIGSVTERAKSNEYVSRDIALRILSLVMDENKKTVTRSDMEKLINGKASGDTSLIPDNDPLVKQLRDEIRFIHSALRTGSEANKLEARKRLSKIALNAVVEDADLEGTGVSKSEFSDAIANMRTGQSVTDMFPDIQNQKAIDRLDDAYFKVVETSLYAIQKVADLPEDDIVLSLKLASSVTDFDTVKRPLEMVYRSVGKLHPVIANAFKKEVLETMPKFKRSGIEAFSGTTADRSIMFASVGEDGVTYYKRKASFNRDILPDETLRTFGDNMESIMMRRVASPDDVSDTLSLAAEIERAASSKTGNDTHYVEPMVVKANNTLDLTRAVVGDVSANSIDWLVNMMDNAGILDATTVASGGNAYSNIVAAIAKKKSVSIKEASSQFSRFLSDDLGTYDSIETPDGLVLVGDNARHINDPVFSSVGYFQSLEATPSSVPTDLFGALINGDVNKQDLSNFTLNLELTGGVPANVAAAMTKFVKDKPMTKADFSKISKYMTVLLGENSKRIRMNGANWLADKIKPVNGVGFYEKLDTNIGSAMYSSKDKSGRAVSIFTMLRSLPGAKSTVERWMSRNKFWGQVPQPDSYKLIVSALRLGDRAINELPPEIKAAAIEVRRYFDRMLDSARAAGLDIGRVDNYLPQIWDTGAIKSNPNDFVLKFKQFFLEEFANGNAAPPIGRDAAIVAEEKALELLKTLTTDGGDGVLLPDNPLRARLEEPFFSRVLNFTPEQTKVFEQYMVNDLEGMIINYTSQIERRKLLTKEFGLGNHAVETYINILSNGRDGLFEALTGRKVIQKDRRVSDSVVDGRVRITTEIVSPIPGRPSEINNYVDTIYELLGETPEQWAANKDRVRNFILNLQDPEVVASQPEFIKRVDAIVNALAEFGGKPSGIDDREIRAMARAVATASMKPFDTPSPMLMKTSRGLRTFQNVTLLAFTVLASIPDVGLPAIRAGRLAPSMKAVAQYAKDPYTRELIRSIGVGTESIIHEKIAHMYNDVPSRLSNAFFNMTFLNSWTNMNREIAALTGFEAFKLEAKKAQDLLSQGRQDSVAYRNSYRFLQRYGLESYATKGAKVLGGVEELTNNDALRYGIMRFVQESIFSPNPNDIPQWAQHPLGQIVFQLKSYPLMMGRMTGYILSEAKKGNAKPLMMLLAVGGGLGMLAQGTQDVVRRRGDSNNDGKADQMFRERLGTKLPIAGSAIESYNDIASALGIDTVEAGGDVDKAIGWWVEGMLQAGGLGLVANLLYSTAEQADNQSYGRERMLSFVAGPSAGTVMDTFKVAQGTLSDSNSDKREMVRTIVSRIPVVGGVREVKEGIVNMAYEKKKPGKKRRESGILDFSE